MKLLFNRDIRLSCIIYLFISSSARLEKVVCLAGQDVYSQSPCMYVLESWLGIDAEAEYDALQLSIPIRRSMINAGELCSTW